MSEEIGIIGAGSWGIALAYLLSKNGHKVVVWSRSESSVEKLRSYHGNEEKLPGVKLDESVEFTSDVEYAVKDKDIIAFEHGYDKKEEMIKLANTYLPNSKVEVLKDLENKDRMTFIYVGDFNE